jgi:hypothetical protein
MSIEDARTAQVTDGRASEPPVVDVNVTVFKRTTYVRDAVRSVLAQTEGRWHLRICDNGPGGGDIADVAAEFLDDPRVSYQATGEELSQAENWTHTINLGTAPFVALLNDDDWWDPDFLRVRVEALTANPACGFAFSEWKLVDDSTGKALRSPIRFPEGVVTSELLARHLLRHNISVPPAVVVRRSTLARAGSFFDARWQYFDWELLARLAAHAPAYYAARHDNSYRRHPTAVTFKTSEDPQRLLRMLAHIETMFEQQLGIRLSQSERRRVRADALLAAATVTHQSGGWRTAGGLFRAAVRTHPPHAVQRTAMGMYAQTILGGRILSKLREMRSREFSSEPIR